MTRALSALVLVALALVVQVSVLPTVAWHGVVPNLVLLVVVACAVTWGPEHAVAVGFAAGLVLDLAPPADHVAGRWALALVAVGWLAGHARTARPGLPTLAGTVLAASFVGTSVFALTGVLLRDPALGLGEVLGGVLLAVAADLLAAAFVVLPALALLRRVDTERALV